MPRVVPPEYARAMRALPRSSLLLLLISTASCSSARAPHGAEAPSPSRTTVEVRNRKLIDFNIYMLDGGYRLRLGLVPGMSTRTFDLPPDMIEARATVRFLMDPVGSDETATAETELSVRQGDQLSLVIQ